MRAKKKPRIRTCSFCKEEIDVDNRDGSFFVKGTVCVHCHCFIEAKTHLKKGAWSLQRCNDYIAERLASLDADLDKRSIKLQLTDWIMKKYDISCLPKYFFTKLDAVYSGTLKNQSRAIPPEHLFDMWQQKEGYLDKVAAKNAMNGREITGINRVNYDLSIIMSRYDAYLNWKAQCEVEKKQIIESVTELQTKPQRQNVTVRHSSNGLDLDIDELIDEI